jgi:hypothetical protein
MSQILAIIRVVYSNPIVRQIFLAILSIIKTQGENLLPVIVKAVEDAALDTSLTNSQRFDKVFSAIKAQFPSIKDNVLKSLIELAVVHVQGR